MSIISHRQYHFESLKQYYYGKPYIYWCVQSHPEDRGDFGQGSTDTISECNNQLELSVYNMWCSYMVLTNPHMKPRNEFIIMKIFMKIVKICPKSPRFNGYFREFEKQNSNERLFCNKQQFQLKSKYGLYFSVLMANILQIHDKLCLMTNAKQLFLVRDNPHLTQNIPNLPEMLLTYRLYYLWFYIW